MAAIPPPVERVPDHHVQHVSNGNGNGVADMEKRGRPLNHAVTPGGHAVDNSQPAFPVYHRRFANPAPLGLFAFATTTFVLSMANVNTRGLNPVPNIVVGMAFGYGGLAQLLAGMWEFACGNTFGATAFSTYGGFWISFGCIYVPWFNILNAYETSNVDGALGNAVALYLTSWFIVTFILLIACLRSSVGLIAVFFFLTLTFLLLAVGDWTGSNGCHTAGGALGITTAFIAWYVGLAGLLTPDTGFFVLPVGQIPTRN